MKQSKSILLYQRLKKEIEQNIYPFGSTFPSERELSEKYFVSRATVRAAISNLLRQKYLQKIPRKGTYVIKNFREDLKINFKGMSELLKEAGLTPQTIIIASEKCQAGYKLAKIFNVKETDFLFRLMRLRIGNNHKISIEDTYIPYNLVPNIQDIDFQFFSLYDILASYNFQIDYISHRISATKVRNPEAKLLDLDDGSPVISVNIASYSSSQKVIEYTKVIVVSEFCGFYCDSHFNNGKERIYAQDN